MKRSALVRKTELRSVSRLRAKPHKDPVTPEMWFYVISRDGGCIGPRMGMERACFGRLELDHLYNGGIGKRGPSTARNLSTLCGQHHYTKTVEARRWRPVINAYLSRLEDESPW